VQFKPAGERFRREATAWLEANGLFSAPSWLLSGLGDKLDRFKAASAGHRVMAGHGLQRRRVLLGRLAT